jgi:hypothetical protein
MKKNECIRSSTMKQTKKKEGIHPQYRFAIANINHFFLEFSTRLKIWGTFTKFCEENNFLCEKGDEITRFDGGVICRVTLRPRSKK